MSGGVVGVRDAWLAGAEAARADLVARFRAEADPSITGVWREAVDLLTQLAGTPYTEPLKCPHPIPFCGLIDAIGEKAPVPEGKVGHCGTSELVAPLILEDGVWVCEPDSRDFRG